MKLFDSIKLQAPKLNKFDLSHERKFTMAMGDLVPCCVQHVVPGDQMRFKPEVFMRFNPLLSPVMHRVHHNVEYFFVPYRLLWDEFEQWVTGGEDGLAAPIHPKINLTSDNCNLAGVCSLADYMGIPTLTPGDETWPGAVPISALPFRAYQLIWNEYYRDQNVQDKIEISKASGVLNDAQTQAMLTMRKRSWEKDYFTSALPFAQRGAPVVTPIEGNATVNYKPSSELYEEDGTPAQSGLINSGSGFFQVNDGTSQVSGRIENIDSVSTQNVGFTINDLRVAVRVQEWLERAARGGSRYIEMIKSFFGKTSSDARLQRPEYLSGTRKPVIISEVLQTSETQSTPQGTMAGHAYSASSKKAFHKSFEEHGVIIGIISVLPTTAYQQGLSRDWQKFDKFDLLWPTFANLGEQAVKNKELYINPDNPTEAASENTFGYQSRYAEYKYTPSTVHGEMKTTRAFWHMGRIFPEAPALNADFIQSNPTTRIFPVDEEEQQLIVQMYQEVHALRPLPYYGVPQL